MSEPVTSEPQPAPPAAPTYQPVAPPVQPAAAKRRGYSPRRLIIWAVVIVVVLIGGYVYRHATGDPDIAKVGDCMTGQSESTLKVVGCGDANAQWTVVGKVDNQSEPSGDGAASQCAPWPTAEASFWKGDEGGKGYILCLAQK